MTARVSEAMIVAGGGGTRLRPLTSSTPKPLLPFCGRPLLAGFVQRLAGAGIRRVLLVVGADTAPFEAFARAASAPGLAIEVIDEPEPLDTAGGVLTALDRVTGPFLVLNGDVLTDLELRSVADEHLAHRPAATIVLTRVADTSTYGVCVREGRRITAFVEKPPPGTLPGHDTVNAGTYVLEPDVLARFGPGPVSFEREVFPTLVGEGEQVNGVVDDGPWMDLGTPERYRAGHRLALDGTVQWPGVVAASRDGRSVESGAHVHPDARLEAPVLVCERATVGANAHLGPHVVVGPGAHVDARVRDSVVFAGAVVEADADGLVAGFGARVESGALLGRGVVLGDAVVVAAGQRLADDARVPG